MCDYSLDFVASRYGNVERSGASATAENEKPGLSFRFQIPGGIRCQIDALKYEVWVGNKQPPFGGELVRMHFKISRPGVRHQDGVFDVELAMPARIEQAECGVAALLEFCNDEAGANRMNRSAGNENNIVCRHRMPHDQIGDRVVVDGLA